MDIHSRARDGECGSHRECGAVATGREASYKEGVGLWTLCPVDPMVGCLLAPRLAAVHHKLNLLCPPAHRHLVWEETWSVVPWEESGYRRHPLCPASHAFLLNLSPCAIGQPLSAGGSGPEAGGQGPLSVRQSVRGSGRVPMKARGSTGALQRARGPGKQHVGGRASRSGT